MLINWHRIVTLNKSWGNNGIPINIKIIIYIKALSDLEVKTQFDAKPSK